MTEYNPRLDALRALCVFGVMCFHWQGILQFGWIGVQTFFVLSGFLITGILIHSKDRYDATNFFLVFQWRRALRIFPGYFGYILVLAGVFWLTQQPASLPEVFPFLSTLSLNIARLFPWFENHQAYSHLWSLGVEAQFYLLWPLLIYFTDRRRLPVLLYLLFARRTGPATPYRTAGLSLVFKSRSRGKCRLQFPTVSPRRVRGRRSCVPGNPRVSFSIWQEIPAAQRNNRVGWNRADDRLSHAGSIHPDKLSWVPDQSPAFLLLGLGLQLDQLQLSLPHRAIKHSGSPFFPKPHRPKSWASLLRPIPVSSPDSGVDEAPDFRKE
jgi:hypothetical protein